MGALSWLMNLGFAGGGIPVGTISAFPQLGIATADIGDFLGVGLVSPTFLGEGSADAAFLGEGSASAPFLSGGSGSSPMLGPGTAGR